MAHTATEIRIPKISKEAPARSMAVRVTNGLPNTMAFGGVATGNMKPIEADSATGSMNINGSAFMAFAAAPPIGTKIAAIAVLLASSPT